MQIPLDSLLSAAAGLLAVLAAAYAALHGYFRQREYELVQDRYLKTGVDAVALQLESTLNITSHNYARAGMLLKLFRDAGEHFDVNELRIGFQPFESARFNQTSNHRIEVLLDSKAIWSIYQTALAYATAANSFFTLEVPQTIQLRLTTSMLDAKSHAEIAEDLLKHVRSEHESGYRFATLLAELHYLGRLLETERLSFSSVSRFHRRREVLNMLKRLDAAFPEDNEKKTAA